MVWNGLECTLSLHPVLRQWSRDARTGSLNVRFESRHIHFTETYNLMLPRACSTVHKRSKTMVAYTNRNGRNNRVTEPDHSWNINWKFPNRNVTGAKFNFLAYVNSELESWSSEKPHLMYNSRKNLLFKIAICYKHWNAFLSIQDHICFAYKDQARMYINNEMNYTVTKTNVRLKTNWIQLYGHLQAIGFSKFLEKSAN